MRPVVGPRVVVTHEVSRRCAVVLPARHRLRNSADFGTVVRSGRRSRQATLVLHVLTPSTTIAGTDAGEPDGSVPDPGGPDGPRPVKVGLIVSKSVGGSVTRHAVSRRLRAQLAATIDSFAPASHVVVRALPASAAADSATIAADLRRATRSVAGQGGGRR